MSRLNAYVRVRYGLTEQFAVTADILVRYLTALSIAEIIQRRLQMNECVLGTGGMMLAGYDRNNSNRNLSQRHFVY